MMRDHVEGPEPPDHGVNDSYQHPTQERVKVTRPSESVKTGIKPGWDPGQKVAKRTESEEMTKGVEMSLSAGLGCPGLNTDVAKSDGFAQK